MQAHELAERTAAWTWAARTLGIEVDEHRLAGLVEVTRHVRLENLKPALDRAMQTEGGGFLPSPGKVMTCAGAIERERQRDAPRLSAGTDVSRSQHEAWMREHNPEGWSNEQWLKFERLLAVGGAYKREVMRLKKFRFEWVDEQRAKLLRGKRVSHAYRIRLQRDLVRDSRLEIPNPCPLEWESA